MKKILSILLLMVLAMNGFAQKNISGGIFTNEVWTKANSPYTIVSNTTIFPGVKLTIEPGVIVKFQDDILFTVRGTLDIQGLEEDSVLFTAATINTLHPEESWDGITTDIGQGGLVKAKYLNFEYSYYGFFLETSGNASVEVYNFSHCTFRNNSQTIAANDYTGNFSTSITFCTFFNNAASILRVTNALIENCLFKYGGLGIYTSYPVLVKNCEFSDLMAGIQLQNGTADNCYIHHCITGVALWPGLSVINSRLEYNETAFQESYPLGYITNAIHDNIICGNTFGIKGNTAYPYDISNNCWCADATEIPDMIYDAHDGDPTLGIITFQPILTGCTITPPRPITPPIVIPPIVTPPIVEPPVTPVTTSNEPFYKNITLAIFPNPTTQTIYFNRDINNSIVTIFNTESKIVFKQKINELSIDVSNFTQGYYIVYIQNQSENYHLSFIKE